MKVKVWLAKHRLATAITAGGMAVIVALSVVLSGTPGKNSPSDVKAPQFSLPLLAGSGRVALSDYAGKPVILNFWGSWCTDCMKETSLLVKFDHELAGRASLIGVDESDSTSAALSYAHAHDVGYTLVSDPNYTAADAYGMYLGIPQTLFIDARHHIVDRIFGAATPAQLTKGLRLMGLSSLTVTG